MRTTRTRTTIATVAAVATLGLGGAAVAAGGEDASEDESPIPAAQYDRATAAALAVVPGTVTATEAGDEEGAYEVEVTRADGSEVDVHLDEDFAVIGQEADGAGGDPGDD